MNNDIAHQPSRIPRIAWAIFMITLALAILPAATLRADRAEEDALRKSTRDAALERGMSAVDAKSWKLAAQYFEEARKANPGDPEVLFKLALATDRIGRRELLAIAWYRAFLATVPDAQTVARVKKQILVLEMRAEAKLLALLQTIEKTADMITDTKEKSGWFKDIARMQAELKDLVGQMEGSGDGQQAASTKAENIGEWTHRAHFWQEEQVIVNFDGFLKEQQGKSPAEATKVLIEAARELQFAVLLTRGAPSVDLNSIGMKFRLIPAGEFMMGSRLTSKEVLSRFPGEDESFYKDEHPQHRVRITSPFYMGATEVTVGDFKKFIMAKDYKTTAEKEGTAWVFTKEGKWVEISGRNWRSPGFSQTDCHPVTCVSWTDAIAFCQWLSKKEGRTYRLPTEAQWEYACRAGTATVFSWGDDPDDGKGYLNGADEGGAPFGKIWPYPFKFKDSYLYTSPTGKFRPNTWGLYDMHGNVYEWCQDWYGPYPNSLAIDPRGPTTGSGRVPRGGSWRSQPEGCRSAIRYIDMPSNRYDNLGFRLVFVLTE